MPNIVNEAITIEYEEALKGELDALVVQPVGLTVEDVNTFRGMLDEANLRMKLVKGSLARRIMEANGLSGLDSLFVGPSALILGGRTAEETEEVEGAAIAASRVVESWRKESGSELPAVKGGVMEGEVLDENQAVALAKLPTKAQVQATVLGQILSPASSISGQLIAGGGKIAGAIKSHIEKLEGGEG